MDDPSDTAARAAMGARLKAVRQALGLSQKSMADTMGITVTALSAWEVGRNRLDIVKLARAAQRYGFTTDWISLGDVAGVRKDLADQLEAPAGRGPDAAQRGRPRRESKVQGCVMQLRQRPTAR